MIRDILTNKRIIGAVFGLLIIFAGCFWYYQHTTAPYKAELEKTDKLLKQREANKAKTPAETRTTDTPEEIITQTEKISDNTETNTDKPTKTVNIATPEKEDTQEAIKSPHGFGEYPKVPEDYPTNVNWSSYEDEPPIYELMTRVRIKLWEEGRRSDGIVEQNGLLYPIMRGTIYIKWSDNGKDIIGITGHPKDLSDDVEDQMYESGTIPAGFTVIDHDKAGIDPYKFLNL